MTMKISDIETLLGSEAKDLLTHVSKTIPKEQLTLPGPDFVDRVFAQSDRPVPVLRNLQGLFDHGRLGGTGYLCPLIRALSTLVDQLLRRTRSILTRITSSNWRLRAAATAWLLRWAFWVLWLVNMPTRSPSS